MSAVLNETQAVAGSIELTQLDLLVTSQTGHRRWVRFTGESPAWLDARVAAYLNRHPHLSIDLSETDVCWSALPKTFDIVLSR